MPNPLRNSAPQAHHNKMIGVNTNHQDKAAGSAKGERKLIKILAAQPGLHSNNQYQRSRADAFLGLISTLAVANISNRPSQPQISLPNTALPTITDMQLGNVTNMTSNNAVPLSLPVLPHRVVSSDYRFGVPIQNNMQFNNNDDIISHISPESHSREKRALSQSQDNTDIHNTGHDKQTSDENDGKVSGTQKNCALQSNDASEPGNDSEWFQEKEISPLSFYAYTTPEQKVDFIKLLKQSGIQDTAKFSSGVLKDKEPFIVMVKHDTQEKFQKISMQQSLKPGQDAAENYAETHCRIRTKTVSGHLVGDGLLVASEYTRNPVRGIAEKIKEHILPGQPLTEGEVIATEVSNAFGYDMVLAFFTGGAYPIVKYGAAKALAAAGHTVNADMTCLKREFSDEALAELLFDTEVGLTERRGIHQVLQPKPPELSGTHPFKPSGTFVQENLSNGIHTEKYLRVNRNGEEIRIREKRPGEYVTFHPDAVKPELVEKRIFFDAKTQQIHFAGDLPQSQGMNFDVVDGKKYITLQGENFELNYNVQNKQYEIKIERESGVVWLPVYKEKLSHTWHLHKKNDKPVFSAADEAFLNLIKMSPDKNSYTTAVDNLNPRRYGKGKINELRFNNEPLTVLVAT